jgi:hypothetical protein
MPSLSPLIGSLFAYVCLVFFIWMQRVMLATTTSDNGMSTNSNRDLGRVYLDVASHLFRLKSLGGVCLRDNLRNTNYPKQQHNPKS